MDMSDAPVEGCFLCAPEPEWTWHESESFRAVLGLGPVGPGYTLIATREHLPSMLDLDADLAAELERFTAEVRERLGPLWGPSIVGEHGRVAPCTAAAVRRHEPHCLHAHRLVFPGQPDVDLRASGARFDVMEFAGFREARRELGWEGQYVYLESATGACQVGLVQRPLPRQFLRALVAARNGHPELADWRRSPRADEVDAARRALAAAAA